MKKRRILMGKTHLIAGAVMLAVAGGQLSAQTVAPKTQSKLFLGERTSPLRTKRQHYPRFDTTP